jgi:hypothetical protein
MHCTDKKGYDEFIKNQREDFEKGQKKERERREKERIITGTSLCSFRILVARIINKEKSVTDSIKLFDFNANAEMNDKQFDGADSDKPLEQPKLYLNILFHDKVITPLKKDRKPASLTDDKEWAIIPISFSPPKERWSGSGMKCIHVDAYVNTCVASIFK